MAALAAVWARAEAVRLFLPRRSLSCWLFSPLPSAPVPLPGPAWPAPLRRAKSRGTEYRPNNWKRKRTHGWVRRISTPAGIAVILRRMLKGRKSLSH